MGVVLGRMPPLALNTFSPTSHVCPHALLGGRTNIPTLLVYTETLSCRELNLVQADKTEEDQTPVTCHPPGSCWIIILPY